MAALSSFATIQIVMEQTFAKSRVKNSYLPVIVSIALILFSLGLLALLVVEARNMSRHISENFQISIYINDGSSDVQIMALKDSLQQQSFTKSTFYISKQQALDSLRKELGDDAMSMIENNPLPASIDLFLKSEYATDDRIKEIASQIQTNKIVQEVTWQTNEINAFAKNIQLIGFGILGFSALLLIISIALINNTVRLAVYSRRFLIKSMQLVGATKNFIVLPFLGTALRNGFYAVLLASVLLVLLLLAAHSKLPDIIRIDNYPYLAAIFGGLLLSGIFISVMCTYFSVRKFLRLKLDELYY